MSEPANPRSRAIDVLSIGETMALVVPARAEPLESADDFRLEAGGAESNLACHLAAAGLSARWFSALGDDPLGHRIRRRIESHGVSTDGVVIDDGAPTGVYIKDPGHGVHYYRAGSAASRLSPAALDVVDWSTVDTVHLTGITLALSPSCRDLVHAAIDAARSHDVRVSFDVNHRPALWPDAEAAARTIADAAARADAVFVGRDEAERLWGTSTAADIRSHLPHVPHLVVKDADVEATEFGPVDVVTAPAHRVEVVEAVGAGDAFAAGWLGELIRGGDARRRLENGHATAARALAATSDVPQPDPSPSSRGRA